MLKNVDIIPDSLLNQKTLITGETGSGKTITTFLFLLHLLKSERYQPEEISIIDFGPPRVHTKGVEFAGTLMDYRLFFLKKISLGHSGADLLEKFQQFLWITSRDNPYRTPRYSASDVDQVLSACYHNYKHSSAGLHEYLSHPTKVLVVNDLGIYLHLGGINLVKKAVRCAETVIMNAYLGQSLVTDYGSNISTREKKLLIALGKTDKIVHYSISSIPSNFLLLYPDICENL